jgi:dihydrofolate reductase
MLSLIAVIGKNRELGKDNALLWHVPGDLPRFKKITWGHPVVMGRKTHSTFQYKGGALPGRTNIIVTHDTTFAREGFTTAHSVDEALLVAKKSPGSEEIFIIGGGSLYKQTISIADRLYLTLVDATADADTFFPDYSTFKKTVTDEPHASTEFHFRYVTLEARE